ncbi:centrosomal protein of 112 kDa isoform X2 [Hypomesus transpacificus]|uniref:centrosomal protein of 112 kDa isoform X2 n=1 Tax=Hypomesus transpacificus TaxID=137520 RepID=UPI001F082641|nr:centrosomal protein of 112 kDa isoform X2 [Hypomesus transpacificus]
MSKHEDAWDKLDTEFDHYLVDMKPYVLKLPHKSERQRCALWIKKLCEPTASSSGLMGLKNRNMYARLLLHMLRRDVLEGPFTQKPESGTLKTLPTYMSIYFDEPLCGKAAEQSSAGVPDWVTGELDQRDEIWESLLKERASSSPMAYQNTHRRGLQYEEKSSSWVLQSSPVKRSSRADLNMIENPRYLKEDPIPLSPIFKLTLSQSGTLAEEKGSLLIQEKEMEMKTKVLCAKHQEDKLKLQQRHDADVQKILDRKNWEIEELKTMHRVKQKESEDNIRKMERKVQSVVLESQVICESKEKQIFELKKMTDQSADSLKNEWEKKLHLAVADMEQEKFELQKKHTESIQELVEDTNQRLAKMETEYSVQTQATEQMLREMERQVKRLSAEVENGNALRLKVTQEKNQLEIHIATISSELQEANRRNVSLLREKENQSELHEQELQKLQSKHEADMTHYQHEHALSAAKASEVIEDLEQIVAQLKQQLLDSEHWRQKQIRVRSLHMEAEKERMEARKRIAKLEESLRVKEEQLERVRDSQRQHAQQAESALEQLKKQVELSSEKAYADMKLQMEKVEEDLSRSKSLREEQAKEFSHQLEEIKQRCERQMCEQRVQQEQDRTRLQQQHSAEKDSLVQECQREVGSLERRARATLLQHQQHTQEWRQRDAQTISELEAQVSALREELQQANAQRKQQLLELGLLREDERQHSAQDQEASMGRLRAEMERLRLDLERSHQAERELAQEKTNSRLKQIEEEYSQKLAKSAQWIAELQTSACAAKEEGLRRRQELERQLEEALAHWDQERRTMTKHAISNTKALQEKVESLQRQLHASEKKLLNKELENQEQVTAVRQDCELKIKGLMPAELRQELEDTITSLKSQVNFLQKRASVLQDDLDSCRSRR